MSLTVSEQERISLLLKTTHILNLQTEVDHEENMTNGGGLSDTSSGSQRHNPPSSHYQQQQQQSQQSYYRKSYYGPPRRYGPSWNNGPGTKETSPGNYPDN